ncbi:4a-hydroxytetrahydrobiopterin dehydratase [Streptosporangium sp. NBC_01755]|uniref:4a-hydroxytetrahydrobiopterin dehydratase n=1 Tax=unclassified Streptosporangium TaxID=2632669 RepID=UPI002DD84B95|nr:MULTISPECIES: 4a-hydroxytetrahydrobiopterin dehydratase [unclassified Streptosporangium]WSA26514.1 4a-hydroxytetrahydrobiopterin dehydratase [Streptosporangium sp. NBC_01810]WSD02063.1 4a-hydroxytetrahydrobiopterin dehydratase [Streptosporangium sp. NBC_01755]
MGLRDPLPAEEVTRRLASSGWSGDTNEISKNYSIDYDSAMRAVAEIAQVAIELEHRPDIDIRWDHLRIAMTTHTAGDVVTELDFLLAVRINKITQRHGAATT